jgi:hypothetical protein
MVDTWCEAAGYAWLTLGVIAQLVCDVGLKLGQLTKVNYLFVSNIVVFVTYMECRVTQAW